MHTCCYHSQEDKLPKKQNSIEYFQVNCCILLKPFSSPSVKYPKISQAACSHKSFELTGALSEENFSSMSRSLFLIYKAFPQIPSCRNRDSGAYCET
jgi:hypothetical protein